jgi:broad specificity phosphatase PhoE
MDAGLTTLGVSQARAIAPEIAALKPDMIVSSPMTRAIHTCLLASNNLFLETRCRVTINADCRERLAYACDIGSPVPVLQARFPVLDFARVERPEAWWWTPDGAAGVANGTGPRDALGRLRQGRPGSGVGAEPGEVVAWRVARFRHWLVEQSATKIVVFAHGMFLMQLAASAGAQSRAQQARIGNWMDNCEIISMHI